MLGSHSASPDLCRLPSNFNAAADIFMECLTKCLRGDQTRFTSTITTTIRGLCCALGAQQHRGPEPQCAPRNTLNSAHLSCPQHSGPGGGRDESDTVPAHQEPAVCRRGQHTHKLRESWVAGDQCLDTGMRGRLGQAGKRVISLSESGSRTKPRMELCRAIHLLRLCWLLPGLEGLLGLSPPPPPTGLRVSEAPSYSGPAPHSVLGVSTLSRHCLGVDVAS